MAQEWQTVDIWVGRFASEQAADAYFDERYAGDDTPISDFAADMEATFYDHDFMERSFHAQPQHQLQEALGQHSFSSSYMAAAAAAFEGCRVKPFNFLLVMDGEQIDAPGSVFNDRMSLQYLGHFDCDTAAGPAA